MSSFADRPERGGLVVAVTHSPVLRACALEVTAADPGEPAWVSGLRVQEHEDRSVTMELLPEAS
ncbi:hypothetical protein [Pseudonocardia sp. NPDC046786]|uniref:hypothetical protein n=1 Tax=Pseudonocardia sp. NPDC046786 TaxID=3155471 RepID=UPI0033E31BDB